VNLKPYPFYITFVFPRQREAFLYAEDSETYLPTNLSGYITGISNDDAQHLICKGGADRELYGNHVLMLSQTIFYYQEPESRILDHSFDFLEENEKYAVGRSLVAYYQERDYRKELSDIPRLNLRFQIQSDVTRCSIQFSK
jgi:hypothetical protein